MMGHKYLKTLFIFCGWPTSCLRFVASYTIDNESILILSVGSLSLQLTWCRVDYMIAYWLIAYWNNLAKKNRKPILNFFKNLDASKYVLLVQGIEARDYVFTCVFLWLIRGRCIHSGSTLKVRHNLLSLW